jgi:hypothetical protein
MPLKNIRVRVGGGASAAIEALGAGESKEANLPLNAGEQQFVFVAPAQDPYAFRRYSDTPRPATAEPTAAATADLASRRSGRIDAILREHPELACVYAEFDTRPDLVKLTTGNPKEAHRGIVRALVTLE